MNNVNTPKTLPPESLQKLVGESITLSAWVYKIRRASGIVFVTLRVNAYMLQAVYMPELCRTPLSELCEGAFAEFTADVTTEKRAEYGFELTLRDFTVLSRPQCEYPLDITSPTLGASLNDTVNNRVVTMRHPHETAVIRILSAVSHYFEEHMHNSDFVKIHTPKTTIKRSDNGNYFMRVNYFGQDAVLTQSPCLYKHMALGSLDRVYEVGNAYYSKNTSGSMLLSEYTRLDFEMAYTKTLSDVTDVLESVLYHIILRLSESERKALDTLNAPLPKSCDIPKITFTRATEILDKADCHSDLDPTDIAKLCRYTTENFGSEFVIVTDLPSKKQPFYTCESKLGGDFRDCFVLLFRGCEIAYGSRNVCDCAELVANMEKVGLNPTEYAEYVDAYKYGIPPHGGCAIGLERFVAKLLNLSNIRLATLFPRDMHHITP